MQIQGLLQDQVDAAGKDAVADELGCVVGPGGSLNPTVSIDSIFALDVEGRQLQELSFRLEINRSCPLIDCAALLHFTLALTNAGAILRALLARVCSRK